MVDTYHDADNGSQSLIGVSFALLALTTVFFVCFLFSKYHNGTGISKLMLWLVVVAYIFNAGNAIDNALSAILGQAGKHNDTLDHDTNMASGKIGKAADFLYIFSAIFPKLAMLAFYSNVFPGRIYGWTIYGCAGLLVFTLLAGVLQTTLICKPFSAYWDGNGTCGDMMASYRWLSYPNLITDFVMLVMPFPILLKLNVSKATKIRLVLTFVTGSLGIITAILRIVSFYTIPIFDDPTYYLIQPSIYSVVEPSAYLICAIMPQLARRRSQPPKPPKHTAILHTSTASYPDHQTPAPTTSRSRAKPGHENTNTTIPNTPTLYYRSYLFSPSKLLSRFSGTGTFMSSSSQQRKNDKTNGIDEPDLELGKVGLSPRARQAMSSRTEVGTGTAQKWSSRQSNRRRGAHSAPRAGEICRKEEAFLPSDAIVRKTDIALVSESVGSRIETVWGRDFGVEGVRGDAENGGGDADGMLGRSVESDGSLEGKSGAGVGLDGDGDEVPLNGSESAADKGRTRKRRSIVAAVI
ncbi:hypothetical protein DM02DRAFT_650242 [Periconia macrospinosa]|uniref:Rhodopsin domain-containing protein n=1 Tax=Periconia macrospinosa TaxID=97972 RepID=A0A2V1E8H6_9PLEO|nr:hypothetical protein DM02DRAFT_650242 [Periconia macrospinosa]